MSTQTTPVSTSGYKTAVSPTSSASPWETILTEVLGAFMAGQLWFTIGDVAVSISSTAGEPVKFTLATAIYAAEQVFLGAVGTLQVGTVVIAISKQAPSVSNATPESATLAAAIATSVTPSGPAAIAAPIVVGATEQLSAIQPGAPAYPVRTIEQAVT